MTQGSSRSFTDRQRSDRLNQMAAPERPISAIEALPSSERLLLESICVLGEADTYTLAQRTFISVTACRQHLRELDRAGLIAARQKKGDIRRPLTLYRLT